MVSVRETLPVLDKDFVFSHRIEGLPGKLSDIQDLRVGRFRTSDGVALAYWEAGTGTPLVFVPGWAANGAEYVNLLYLLRRHYHVHVLDPRNQGLSERTGRGMRIARFAADLKEFAEHAGLDRAHYCGWSMGAAILWSHIDLFGTAGIGKLAFVDQPPAHFSRAHWTEQERLDAGATTREPERMVEAYATGAPLNALVAGSHAFEQFMRQDVPCFQNSESFARTVVENDMDYTKLILFDHIHQDWRDLIRSRIDVPVAVFTGVHSDCLPSQHWIHAVLPGSALHVYSDEEHGDHFLMLKNPRKFAADLHAFLQR